MKTKSIFSIVAFILGVTLMAFGHSAEGVALATVPAAGTFSCTNIQEIVGKSDLIWMDNAARRDYIPKVGALEAIIANQTAKLDPITGQQNKDHTLKVTWLSTCELALADCGDRCEIVTGTEASSVCKTYAPNLCKTVAFTVNQDELRTNTLSPDEVIAKLLLQAIKQGDEYFAKQVVLALDANKGHNLYEGVGDIVGTGVGVEETYINPALWNAALLSEFILSAEMNRMQNAFLLSGSNLWKEYLLAQANSANANGKGDANLFEQMNMYFDPINVDGQLSPDKMTFLIDKGALAFGARWRETTTPVQYLGQDSQIRYSVASKTLPNVSYDIHYDTTCIDGKMHHRFNLFLEGGIYFNPVGCNENQNGIIAYKNAVAP